MKKLGITITKDGLMLSLCEENEALQTKIVNNEWFLVDLQGKETYLGKPKSY
jgi:hypothetical protein